ncbi:MAG: EAL domain-containing protein [Planctomycetaceae bacterium]|nr:EAL domain-containing protein [Planctomycetaceae bacterium]
MNHTILSQYEPTAAADGSRTAVSEFPAASDVQWALHGHLSENGTALRTPILSQPFTVGRHPDNSLSICNSTVSGYHAELLLANDSLLVRDRNSTNGTLLNGRRIQTVESLRDGDILHFGNVMFTVQRDHSVAPSETVTADAAGDAIAHVQFNTFLSRPGVEPYFQPIVRMDSQEVIGFEVLSRSHFVGLETPAKMFKVAAERTSEAALSRVCRLEGMRVATKFTDGLDFYLNTHPVELNQSELFDSLNDLRKRYPKQSIVLEVHESGVTSVAFLKSLRSLLNELDFRLAYDDFGAGQARLTELIEVPPDVLKFDVKLIQGLPTASDSRRSTVAGLIRIVRDLNVVPLAEGVETHEEAEICRELGFELAQGYLFGRGEPAAKWLSK